MPINEVLAALMFVAFIALLFTGFPVAWIMGGLAVVFTVLAIIAEVDLGIPLGVDWAYTSLAVDRMWDVMKNWVLVSLPLFIFMGLMLDRSGIAEKMMVNFARVFGGVRGGMALVVALIGILLAASTGIVGASVTLLALLGLPVMLNNRYSPELATGTVAAVGTLGILIPPSIMLVVMGDRLSLSVGDLFLGALIPGLLLGALYMVYIVVVAWLKPEVAPLPARGNEGMSAGIMFDFLKSVLPAALLILAVLGTIFFGIATPTEAAGIGALGAMILAASNRNLNVGVLREAGRQTTKTTGYIFALIIGATAYSLVLRGLGGDQLIEDLFKQLPGGSDGVVIAVLLLAFVLGFFMDWIEITLIVLPLVAPVVKAAGFDLVWFTVLFAVVLQSSFLTPPVGFSLFYLKGVAPKGVTTGHIYRGILPFNVMILATVVLVYVWKDLVLWLPKAAYGN
ncbi:MAG TPA: TRAP transporter large permease subunit [Burkholderiaceae bacterium]|nr:TRAP transporter large permease subunit [Burkholderiaceae bacterium]